MMFEFTVPGKPVAWQRVEPGRGGRPHDTARNREEKARIGMLARLAGARPVSGGVELWVTFVFRRPRCHFLRDGTLRPDAPMVHFVKPDADNLLKLVKDALTGVAYCDDCQVARVHMAKEWTETGMPGTTIALEKAL